MYLGLCDAHIGKYETSRRYLNEAIAIFVSFKDNFHTATTYSYLGDLYYEMHDYDASIRTRLKAKQILDTLGAKEESADIADNIARDYLQKKDYADAFKIASQSLIVAKEINAVAQQYYLYTSLAKADSGLGDFKGAICLAFLVKAVALHAYAGQPGNKRQNWRNFRPNMKPRKRKKKTCC